MFQRIVQGCPIKRNANGSSLFQLNVHVNMVKDKRMTKSLTLVSVTVKEKFNHSDTVNSDRDTVRDVQPDIKLNCHMHNTNVISNKAMNNPLCPTWSISSSNCKEKYLSMILRGLTLRTTCRPTWATSVLNMNQSFLHTRNHRVLGLNLILQTEYNHNMQHVRHYAKKGKKDKGGQKKKTGHKVDLSEEDLLQVIDHDKLHVQMLSILEQLQQQYLSQLKLRTTAGAFDELIVETEDGKFPLIQIAQITQKNPSMVMIDLTVMPQYLTQVKEAISNSGMNVNPQQDGTTLFVQIPKVSREHRESLAKSAKSLFNASKEKMREVQNKFVKDCKQKQKAGTSSDLVDNVIEYVRNVHVVFVGKAEELMKSKQQELMGK